MKFFKVYTDIGAHKPVLLYAKMTKKINSGSYEIKYISPVSKLSNGTTIYDYEDMTYTIDDESIIEYIDGPDENVIGYQKVNNGWVKCKNVDPDYEPSVQSDSDEESDEEDSESEDFSDDISEDDEDDIQDEEYGGYESSYSE